MSLIVWSVSRRFLAFSLPVVVDQDYCGLYPGGEQFL